MGGKTVSGYASTQQNGAFQELQPTDLQTENPKWYWHDAGANHVNNQQVSVAATVGGQLVNLHTVFKVVEPSVQGFSAQVGQAQVGQDPRLNGAEALGMWGVQFNDKKGNPQNVGIRFQAAVDLTTTPGFGAAAGRFDLIQTGTAYGYITTNQSNTQHRTDNGVTSIDTNRVDGSVGLSNNGPWLADGTKRFVTDSPYLALDPNNIALTSASEEESFNTYLMFTPTETDSITVPLRKITWWWQGSAFRDGNNAWKADSHPALDQSSNPLSSVETDEFPIWTGKLNSRNWQ